MANRPRTANDPELSDASLGELLKRLGEDTATLVRQEMQLARAELTEKVDLIRGEMATIVEHAREDVSTAAQRVGGELEDSGKKAGAGIGMIAGGAGVALLALGALTAFLVLALDGVMPSWAAALIVAAVYAAVAVALAMAGRTQLRQAFPLVSPRTMRAVKEDAGELISETKERAAGSISELKPEETIETVKEDVEWARHPTRSA